MRPMDAATIDDHHDLFASFTKDTHDLMEILAQLLGIKMGHDLIEDTRRTILDRPDNAEQDAAGDATPGAIVCPGLTFEAFCTSDLALAQRAYPEASPLGCAPPARAGQGKTPEDRFVCIEQNDFATTCLVLESGECKRAVGELSRGGIKTPGGAVVAYILFFNTPRTLSRPSWTPVCWANTMASSRQFHCEERAPCSRGS